MEMLGVFVVQDLKNVLSSVDQYKSLLCKVFVVKSDM